MTLAVVVLGERSDGSSGCGSVGLGAVAVAVITVGCGCPTTSPFSRLAFLEAGDARSRPSRWRRRPRSLAPCGIAAVMARSN